MKTNLLHYGVLALLGTFTIIGLKAADESKAAIAGQSWQHLALETEPEKATSDPSVSEQIVSLGNKGWELVTVLNFSSEGTTTRTVYYFKKPQ